MKPLILLLLTSCGRQGVTPALFSGLTSTEELDLGEAGLAVLSVQPGIYRNTRLEELVTRVGLRLAAIAPGEPTRYRFFILDTDELTALALPGGLIFVSRGLLATMNNEDELAAVLGHEIGHVASRHASRRAALSRGRELMGSVTRWVAGLFNLDAKESELFLDSISARHSRRQEREADRVGVVLAMSLGYEGAALATVLRKIGQTGSPGDPMLLTHPTTPERLEIIDTVVRSMTPGPGLPTLTPASFLSVLDGMPLGPSASNGVLVRNRYISADAAYTIRFPESWEVELGLNGPVATSPDWEGVISVQALGSEPPPVGRSSQLAGRPVFISSEGGMTAHRSRFAAAGRQYELAGLWGETSDHAKAYASMLESLELIGCREGIHYEVRVLRVRVEDGVAHRSESTQPVKRWPPNCNGR
ncbi:MAG: M48 family metalloprotease [Myxococcota bacterium]